MRAAQRFDHLPPEPPLGVSGTTTLTLLSASTPPQRRRYEADDVLEKVMGWLRRRSSARRHRGPRAGPPAARAHAG